MLENANTLLTSFTFTPQIGNRKENSWVGQLFYFEEDFLTFSDFEPGSDRLAINWGRSCGNSINFSPLSVLCVWTRRSPFKRVSCKHIQIWALGWWWWWLWLSIMSMTWMSFLQGTLKKTCHLKCVWLQIAKWFWYLMFALYRKVSSHVHIGLTQKVWQTILPCSLERPFICDHGSI